MKFLVIYCRSQIPADVVYFYTLDFIVLSVVEIPAASNRGLSTSRLVSASPKLAPTTGGATGVLSCAAASQIASSA